MFTHYTAFSAIVKKRFTRFIRFIILSEMGLSLSQRIQIPPWSQLSCEPKLSRGRSKNSNVHCYVGHFPQVHTTKFRRRSRARHSCLLQAKVTRKQLHLFSHAHEKALAAISAPMVASTKRATARARCSLIKAYDESFHSRTLGMKQYSSPHYARPKFKANFPAL